MLTAVSIFLSPPCLPHYKATLYPAQSRCGYPSINTWQSEFIERQPMRALLLGRASVALGQSETRNRTRASELCSDVITWRWEKECQHGPVARTGCECAPTITRRRKNENTKIAKPVDGAALLRRASSQQHTVGRAERPGSSCPDHPETRRSINRTFFLTQPNLRLVESDAGAVVFGQIAVFWAAAPAEVQAGGRFLRFDGPIFGSGLVLLAIRSWARRSGPCLPSSSAVWSVRPCCNMCLTVWQQQQTSVTSAHGGLFPF